MEVGNKSGMSFISTKLSDNSFDICNDEISYTTNKIAYDSKSALNILKSVRKLDAGDEFYEQQIEKTGFVWDDGSYYMFGIDFKDADSDISCRYMIKKNTADVYVMDINKDSSGNTLKRYQPDN